MAIGKSRLFISQWMEEYALLCLPTHLHSSNLYSTREGSRVGLPGPPSVSFSQPGHGPECPPLASLQLPPAPYSMDWEPQQGFRNRCTPSLYGEDLKARDGQCFAPGHTARQRQFLVLDLSILTSSHGPSCGHLSCCSGSSSISCQGFRDTLHVRGFQGDSSGGIGGQCS